MTTYLHWAGLSREDVANLRNLTDAKELSELLYSYGYGISRGMSIDMQSDTDPNDAEFDLMIDSKEDIPQNSMSEIVNFIKNYS